VQKLVFMKTVFFVTTNKGKAREVKKILKGRVKIVVKPIELHEDHSLSHEQIAVSKAKQAFERLRKPVVVDDTGFFVRGFKDFPGVKSKQVFQKLGLAGFMRKCGGRKAFALTIAAYYDGKKMRLFKGVSKYTISKTASKKRLIEGFPYLSCAIPQGSTKRVADFSKSEMEAFLVRQNHRARAFNKFAKWFSRA